MVAGPPGLESGGGAVLAEQARRVAHFILIKFELDILEMEFKNAQGLQALLKEVGRGRDSGISPLLWLRRGHV